MKAYIVYAGVKTLYYMHIYYMRNSLGKNSNIKIGSLDQSINDQVKRLWHHSLVLCDVYQLPSNTYFASGHTKSKAPDPFRTPKLSDLRRG